MKQESEMGTRAAHFSDINANQVVQLAPPNTCWANAKMSSAQHTIGETVTGPHSSLPDCRWALVATA